jgi:adenosine deaminase
MSTEIHVFRSLPKIELHVHIEGATNPETYFALAQKNKVKLPCKNLSDWKKYFDFENFEHFIQVYETSVSTIKKPEDLAWIIEKFCEYQEQNNIIYSEAFLSASFLVETFAIPEIIEAVQLGIQNGRKKYKTRVNLIPDIAKVSTRNEALKNASE